jgi:hypothetical protein
VSIKLSSTAFASGAEIGPSFNAAAIDEAAEMGDDLSTVSTSSDDSQFTFDKNGVIIPYFTFVTLMDDPLFQPYLKKVLDKFEETEGSLTSLFLTEDLNQITNNGKAEEDEEEEEDVGSKRKRKKVVSLPNDENDEEDDMDRRNRSTTPMAGADFFFAETPAETVSTNNKKAPARKGGISKK